MSTFPNTDTAALSIGVSAKVADFVELTKPRVVLMVLMTTALGYYLGAAAGEFDTLRLLHTLLGTALAAGGTLTLNQFMERDLDARMRRTCQRPIPSGRVQPIAALVFGAILTSTGLLWLTVAVNPLAGLITALTTVSYLFVYTPMKQVSSLCSIVGAVPGALPPVTGWVAAGDAADPGAWLLFAILYLWQLPHSLAIAKLYAEDYARAGFRLLPIVDREGRSTERQIVNNCAALLLVGLLPTVFGIAGVVYFLAALVLGASFLWAGIMMARSNSTAAARRVLFTSLVYLPLLFLMMAVDKVVP